MKRRVLIATAAIVAALVVAGLVMAFDGGPGSNGDGASVEPTATPVPPSPTQPPGIAPGEPTPPPGGDTPVSNRDTPVPQRTPPPVATDPGGATRRVLAPIDATDIAVLESFPPQYLVRITAGLPGGCARADGYEITRADEQIRIAVFNTLPVGNVACTQIYGTYNLNINLGSNFTAGTEYRVAVNDKVLTFRAQ